MGTVIGIFSPKGGTGKTLLATNLAVAVGIGHHKRTILLDLNNGSGTADLLLDLKPDRSWFDLIDVIPELTSQHINLTVTEYRPGLDLLASPPEIIAIDMLSEKYLSKLLDVLGEEYDLVIVDTPAGNEKVVSGALSWSDIHLLVLTPDLPSLRSISRFLTTMPDQEKNTGLVVNQYSPAAAMDPDQIKEYLDCPLFAVLPIDPAGVWANISYGEPCVLRKSSKLGKSIRMLSTRILRSIDQRTAQETKGD